MSPRKRVEYEVSDDDLDELSSLADEDVKPNIGPLAGSLSKPRHVTLSCKQLHGGSQLPLVVRIIAFALSKSYRPLALLVPPL
jgi:hypothetical protein